METDQVKKGKNIMGEKLLDTKEVMARLGISESTMLRIIKKRELQGLKVGKNWRFTEEDLQRYIQQQREKQKQPAATS